MIARSSGFFLHRLAVRSHGRYFTRGHIMTAIGIMGTGRMATRLARLFANAGQQILRGSRSPERAREVVARLGHDAVEPATYSQSAEAPVVLPAIFLRDGLLEILEPLRRRLEEKLWIDITNPFNADYT